MAKKATETAAAEVVETTAAPQEETTQSAKISLGGVLTRGLTNTPQRCLTNNIQARSAITPARR